MNFLTTNLIINNKYHTALYLSILNREWRFSFRSLPCNLGGIQPTLGKNRR